MWGPCSCWAGDYQSLPGGLSPEAWALANEVPRNSFQGDSRPKHRGTRVLETNAEPVPGEAARKQKWELRAAFNYVHGRAGEFWHI